MRSRALHLVHPQAEIIPARTPSVRGRLAAELVLLLVLVLVGLTGGLLSVAAAQPTALPCCARTAETGR